MHGKDIASRRPTREIDAVTEPLFFGVRTVPLTVVGFRTVAGIHRPVSSAFSLGYTSSTKRRQDVSGLRCEQLRQWPLLQPVDVQQALGKEPRAIDLHEGVGVSERGDHQAFLSTVGSDVMRQTVSFACCAVAVQPE